MGELCGPVRGELGRGGGDVTGEEADGFVDDAHR